MLQNSANKVYLLLKINFEDLHKQIILTESRSICPIPLEICGQYYLRDVKECRERFIPQI